MLRPAFRVVIAALLVLLLVGCGWNPWAAGRRKAAAQRALDEARRAPLVVGQVSLVNEDERFALIEGNLVQPPAAGTILRIYSGDAVTAELRATGVRRRPFLVADLVSGTPAKGQLVVQSTPVEAAPPPATPATPAATAAPKPAPIWKRWLGFLGRRD